MPTLKNQQNAQAQGEATPKLMSKVVYTQQPFLTVFGEVQNMLEKQQAFQVGTVKLFSLFFVQSLVLLRIFPLLISTLSGVRMQWSLFTARTAFFTKYLKRKKLIEKS